MRVGSKVELADATTLEYRDAAANLFCQLIAFVMFFFCYSLWAAVFHHVRTLISKFMGGCYELEIKYLVS